MLLFATKKNELLNYITKNVIVGYVFKLFVKTIELQMMLHHFCIIYVLHNFFFRFFPLNFMFEELFGFTLTFLLICRTILVYDEYDVYISFHCVECISSLTHCHISSWNAHNTANSVVALIAYAAS